MSQSNPLTRGKIRKALDLLQRNQAEVATNLLEQVCRTDRRDPQAWFMLGTANRLMGRHKEAAECYTRVTVLQPADAKAHYYLGDTYLSLGQIDVAIASMHEAVRLRPDFIEAHCVLGTLYEQHEDYIHAKECYELALRLDPQKPELHYNLGNVFIQLGHHEQAEHCFRKAIEHRPDYADAYNNLGVAQKTAGKFDEAIRSCRRALECNPRSIDTAYNLGQIYDQLGNLDEAIHWYRRALSLDQNNVSASYNLGVDLARVGRHQEAIDTYQRVLTIAPDHAKAHFNQSLILLRLGFFKEGWQEYQWKWRREGVIPRPYPPTPWDGSDLKGRSVFLHAEQGLGDELFFLRFADELKQRGAGRVAYRSSTKIASLLSRVPIIDCIPRSDERPANADMIFSVGDLPFLLGMERTEQIPPALALVPLPEKLEDIRRKLTSFGPSPYVGITWRAGTKELETALYKEISSDQLANLLRPLQTTVLVLQRDPQPGEIDRFAAALGRPAYDLSALNDDLESMLALLSLIDDYVGVPNTNMHLRAGVGKTARVVVPAPPEWRWMAEVRESPWFPGFTVYRQGYDGNWSSAFEGLAKDLLSLLRR